MEASLSSILENYNQEQARERWWDWRCALIWLLWVYGRLVETWETARSPCSDIPERLLPFRYIPCCVKITLKLILKVTWVAYCYVSRGLTTQRRMLSAQQSLATFSVQLISSHRYFYNVRKQYFPPPLHRVYQCPRFKHTSSEFFCLLKSTFSQRQRMGVWLTHYHCS